MLSALQAHFHAIARAEVQRVSGGVDEKERKARLDLVESAVKKLLHLPMTALRDAPAPNPLAPVARPERPASIRGVDTAEAVDDFCLACVSRAIDDREINLQ